MHGLSRCAAYWLEEKGKDKVRESSALLKAALDILQQYRAALELQADITAAHEARSLPCPPGPLKMSHPN